MSNIAISKIHEGYESTSLLSELKCFAERIRERAFAIFQRRASRDGNALDDWLQAERDLTLSGESELIEKDSNFQLAVALPGFAEKNVKVTALPDAIFVKAESTHHHEKDEGNVYFCQFGEKSLFRRFDLPATIDVDKVTAQLDKGMLRVTAAKAHQEKAAPAAA
jgi:HSP20 family molecular chaperone IbpA